MSQKAFVGILLAAAAIAAISGAVALALGSGNNPGIEIVLPTATPELKVYITGAVAEPGVYTFREGDRLEDAVLSAGDLLPGADSSAVNMAQRLSDEDVFHIPLQGEEPIATVPSNKEGPMDNRININTAPVALLVTLDGIGEVRAQDIVEYRESEGLFRTTADVMKVSGIG